MQSVSDKLVQLLQITLERGERVLAGCGGQFRDYRPVNPELAMEVLEAAEDPGADAGDLVLAQRSFVHLDDVGGGAETVLHHKLHGVIS